jgi:UDP-N-acetylmuramoyl-tripeptide--D-alanyl-D-alanine ligase
LEADLRLTLGWVARAVGGSLTGNGDREIGNVTSDSRALEPGDLFVALRGPRFDGHDFVADVLERGAAGAIVDRQAGLKTRRHDGGDGLIEVDDTLAALQVLARAVRVEAGTRVIAITGSAGKTTTKEAIAEFLSTRFRVVKNKGNLNNHIGLPLSLMQLRSRPDTAVMELGMNHAGEISTLVAIAEPEVRVWTNVGDAHLGFFASPEAIADAKAEILERARRDHVLVCNADDPRVMARVKAFPGRTITFGFEQHATVAGRDVEDRGLDGMRARVVTPAGERVLETPLLGRGNLANVLAATAVAIDSGIPLDEITSSAARLRPAPGRGAVQRLRGGITLIDDSYNSSPAALKRALEVTAAEARALRKIGVLGEMLELGDHALRLHAECGQAAAASGLDRLFVVGGSAARALADAAIEAGMPGVAVTWFENSEEAARAVAEDVRAGDLVLIKGSRGIRTDVVVDRLVTQFG